MRNSHFALAIAVVFVFSRVPTTDRLAHAAEQHVDDVSSVLADSVKKYKLPGMAAAIVEGEHLTSLGAAGVRCRGHEERITTDDLFHIGSDTKSMTATLIALLVEEGKLRWNGTPVEVFGNRGIKEIDPAWQHVTLEELLTHRAGVRPNPDLVTLLGGLALSPREQRTRVCRTVLRDGLGCQRTARPAWDRADSRGQQHHVVRGHLAANVGKSRDSDSHESRRRQRRSRL
jgi:CubicO group peptidase (beta-lactamase class C family)